jgi:hypothetical protein
VVICHLSKSKKDAVNRHYIINILYLYIVSNDRVSEIENDQNDHDHFDHEKLGVNSNTRNRDATGTGE